MAIFDFLKNKNIYINTGVNKIYTFYGRGKDLKKRFFKLEGKIVTDVEYFMSGKQTTDFNHCMKQIEFYTNLITRRKSYKIIDDLYYLERGKFKLEIKDYNGAISDFNKAIELNSSSIPKIKKYKEVAISLLGKDFVITENAKSDYLTDENENIKLKHSSPLQTNIISLNLFSAEIRFFLNKQIKLKIDELIQQKHKYLYDELIGIVDAGFPIDSNNAPTIKEEINEEFISIFRSFNKEQIIYLFKFIDFIFIYSKQHELIELLIYIKYLHDEYGAKIYFNNGHEINKFKTFDDFDELKIVFDIITLLKNNQRLFNYVETVKSRMIIGKIKSEQELSGIIGKEFILDNYIKMDEEFKKSIKVNEQNKQFIEFQLANGEIKIYCDELSKILNEFEDDKFYGFHYIEELYSTYMSIHLCLVGYLLEIEKQLKK